MRYRISRRIKWFTCLFVVVSGVIDLPAVPVITQESGAEDWWRQEYEQGLQLLEEDKLDLAEKTFEAILKKDDRIPEANYGLGLVYYKREQDSKDAEKYFERAAKLDKDYGAAFYQLGLVYMNQKNKMFQAREAFQIAVRRDPTLVDAWGELGKAEAKLWPYGSGLVGIYAKGVKNVPDSRRLYSNFINSAIWQDQADEAVGILEYLIARYPRKRHFELELANLYFDIDRIEESARIVAELDSQKTSVSESQLRLMQAKLAFVLDRPEEALDYYYAAAAAIDDTVDAAAMFSDVKYVMNDAEFEILQRTPLDSIPVFYERFWRSRDPDLATIQSEALSEFYLRLSYARKHFRLFIPGYDEVEEKYIRTHPYRAYMVQGQALLDAAELPEALRGERELDDMGLIYVRHGMPDREVASMDGVPFSLKETEYLTKIFQRVDYYDNLPDVYLFSPDGGASFSRVPEATAGETLYAAAFFANLPSNQSWLYEANAQRPNMIFHFKKWEGQSGWIIESIPYAVAQREVFGERYGRLARESFDPRPDHTEVEKFCKLIHEESISYLRLGLHTETMKYPVERESLPFPFEFLTFKGDSNKTRVELYYAISGRVTDLATDGDDRFLDLDQFVGLYNQQWDEVVRLMTNPKAKMEITETEWDQRAILNLQEFSVAPGDYLYAIRIKDNTSDHAGAYRGTYKFRDFSNGKFLLSDILVSSPLMKTDQPGRFQKGDVTYSPRMFSALMSGSLGGIYFEAYNLQLSKGQSRFKIRCQIRPEGENEKFQELRGFYRSLFAEEPDVVSLQKEYSGKSEDEKLYVNFELENGSSGRYELLVEVEDLHGRQTASITTSFLVQ